MLRGRSLLAASSAGRVGSCGGESFSRVFDTAGAKGRLEGETGKKKLLSFKCLRDKSVLNPRDSTGEALSIISSQVFPVCALAQRPAVS